MNTCLLFISWLTFLQWRCWSFYLYFDRKVVHVFSVELELVILGEVDHGLVVVSLLPPLHRHLLAVLQQRDLGVHVLQVAVVEVVLKIKDVTPSISAQNPCLLTGRMHLKRMTLTTFSMMEYLRAMLRRNSGPGSLFTYSLGSSRPRSMGRQTELANHQFCYIIELETNLREVCSFTITEEAPYRRF